MITLIEALNFRCFKYIRQELGPFHVLVGPNASGKTAFFDILKFLHYLVKDDLETAYKHWSENFFDLFWGREGGSFEIAVEVKIPDDVREKIPQHIIFNSLQDHDTIRYEIRISFDQDHNELFMYNEQSFWKRSIQNSNIDVQSSYMIPHNNTIITKEIDTQKPYIFRHKENDSYRVEVNMFDTGIPSSGGYGIYRDHFKKSNFRIVMDDFLGPTYHWFKYLLSENIHVYEIDAASIMKPAPPMKGSHLASDGSNLSWVVENFKKKYPDDFQEWLEHIQTALPDIHDIRAVVRPEDRNCYLMLKYRNELEVPSWMVSEGTLRLLALTLIVYLPDAKGIYLIEEPENGIHPLAIDTIMQSLQSIYNGQALITTHSPTIVSLVEKLEQILCFTRTDEEGTTIVRGDEHPILKNWRHEVSLGDFFASGVLGQQK